MKKLTCLIGAKALNKSQQKRISGGKPGPILCVPEGAACNTSIECYPCTSEFGRLRCLNNICENVA